MCTHLWKTSGDLKLHWVYRLFSDDHCTVCQIIGACKMITLLKLCSIPSTEAFYKERDYAAPLLTSYVHYLYPFCLQLPFGMVNPADGFSKGHVGHHPSYFCQPWSEDLIIGLLRAVDEINILASKIHIFHLLSGMKLLNSFQPLQREIRKYRN